MPSPPSLAPVGFRAVGAPEVHATTSVFAVEPVGPGEERTPLLCKRLGPRALADDGAHEALRAEGRLLEVLERALASGPAVTPRLRRAGEDAYGPFVVMERVSASPLGARRAPQASWVGRAAASAFAALARIHEARDERGPLGLLHADISPSNVLVSDDGDRAWLVDFGHARWRDAPAVEAGAFRGTLLYVAPEVARGEPFDDRADVFALAASLLHVASGVPPRSAPSPAAALLVAGTEPVDLWASSAAAGLEPSLGEALRACLAFDPEDRPRARDVVRGCATTPP